MQLIRVVFVVDYGYCSQASDCIDFILDDLPVIKFVWLSQMSGFMHLYLIESTPPGPFAANDVTVSCAHFTCTSITQGNWNVLGSKVRFRLLF